MKLHRLVFTILGLIMVALSSCQKTELEEEDALVGEWLFEKVAFYEEYPYHQVSTPNTYEGALISFRRNKEALLIGSQALGDYEGTWRYRESSSCPGEDDHQDLSISLNHTFNQQELNFLWTDFTIQGNYITATQNTEYGVYYYRLHKVRTNPRGEDEDQNQNSRSGSNISR